MPAPGERRRGRKRGAVGEGEQRLDVRAALARECDDDLVHDFLARELHAGDEPPHRGMEPERGAHQFLPHDPRPVVALDVDQFVREHGAMDLAALAAKTLRQQDDGPEQAEGDGLRGPGT